MAVETHENSSPKKTAVGFTKIQIREYPIVVGDNPSILTGTPITIDWEYVEEMEFAVDDYEQQKPTSRNMLELRLPAKYRDTILKQQGFSLKDRLQGRKAANITRSQRRRTAETMKLAPVMEMLELATRATLNATVRRSRKQKEREFLSQFKKEKALSSRSTSTELTLEMDLENVKT